MTSTITFEPAKSSDFDYFYKLRRQTMEEHYVRVEEHWDHETELQKHRNYLNQGTVRLIYNNGIRIGCVSAAPHENGLRISLFCIEPEHQRKGLGEKVLQKIIEEAVDQRKDIFLDVLVENPVCALYERLGFERVEGDCPILVYYKKPCCFSVC
ncbi:MAG: GNAT family N-acetyltransferase [Bdellovibrionales bacterium]